MQHLTQADALLQGVLIDVTDLACEQGFEMLIYASAAVMQAHGVRGIRAIVVLISQIHELAEGDGAPVLVQLRAQRDAGAGIALDVLREPHGDGHAITVTLADGGPDV